ncbi:beta family protein [Wohlfahrtiimonas chitiniclastica]|uniref:beta family protein n=1 Tax=Wohlfahrtiimonas chitiniclastica TaxID=400946 RepID=UPI000B97F270|nr:beta family protein [Wohlfahrtiimonas chitiniclastica]OYQ85110.1 hypothetical protein B9T14_01120 [Wohlfahrtiimonas chitiniclastica]OYQ86656.1 hypothetical protein B9T15_03920 [Wohlfahrtiimonas chitiniclastica]
MIKKYMPILRGKSGEFTALKNLSEDIKKQIIPLIEVDPVDVDLETEEPKKTYNDHLEGYVKKFQDIGDGIDTYLIDANLIEEEYINPSDIYPINNIFDQLTNEGIIAIPVITLDSNEKYYSAVKKLTAHGLCLRLEPFDLLVPDKIKSILQDMKVTRDQVHLIVDFKYIDDHDVYHKNIQRALTAIPHANDWRSIAFSSGSFPVNMGVLDRGISEIPRVEWIVWKNLLQEGSLPTNILYSDYAIQHPEYKRLDVDPRFLGMTASIRYTGQDDFIVIKGKDAKRHGFDQFGDHCQVLVAHSEYSGENFSEADSQIYLYAEKRNAGVNKGFGNATTWRWIGTNHHITLVVNQLSN